MNLAEILEELQVDESEGLEVRDIFIEPPDPNALSDEDSANEDEGGTIDNLSSRQLAANAEVVYTNEHRIGFDMDMELPFDVLPEEMLPSTAGDHSSVGLREKQNNNIGDNNSILVSDKTSNNQPTADLAFDILPDKMLSSTAGDNRSLGLREVKTNTMGDNNVMLLSDNVSDNQPTSQLLQPGQPISKSTFYQPSQAVSSSFANQSAETSYLLVKLDASLTPSNSLLNTQRNKRKQKTNKSVTNIPDLSKKPRVKPKPKINESVTNKSDMSNKLQAKTSKRKKKSPAIQNQNVTIQPNMNNKPKANRNSQEKQAPALRSWKSADLSAPVAQVFPESDFSRYADFSPVELFELFFDPELFLIMVQEIQNYAAFKNIQDPNVSVGDLKCFLGVLTVSGYNKLPGARFYWQTCDDMRNELIYNSMRRNRFLQILSLLHFADNNNIDRQDKLWKLRPLIEKLRTNFREHFVPVQQLDYDESMIAYYGRHSCKQFIRGKPIRFGYKVWCLNTFSGYLVDFEVYQGKSVKNIDANDKAFGKAAAPMVRMLGELGQKKLVPYHIYFDNLFTGINLLVYLRQQNYHGTGTIRANRIPNECDIISAKEIRSKERGFFEYKVSDDNILIARWQDNAPVTVASTIHAVNPLQSVNRYSKSEKKTVTVKRPALVGEYNKFMGGTDLMDENINRYRVSVRSKKWWWSIFSWTLDVCYQNAWYLYNMSHQPKMSQLEFKRAVAVNYLKTYGTQPQVGGRPALRPQSAPAFEELRYDRIDHFIIQNYGNKRRRCAGSHCNSQVRTGCKKCDVGLCIPCFLPFHQRM